MEWKLHKLLWVRDNHADISQCFLVINTLSRVESHCLIMFENSYDESPYQHELQKA